MKLIGEEECRAEWVESIIRDSCGYLLEDNTYRTARRAILIRITNKGNREPERAT
jgi:hypothetical protein